MHTLTINGHSTTVPDGATVLDAARGLGIRIPTLCHREGHEPFTSCMLCVVEDRGTGRIIPSCSARAVDGMEIETDSPAVRDARKVALELLLSDHEGDCEAPCTRICPAHLNIPLMLRQIIAGAYREALVTTKETIPFPAVLGRICPAPCEKGCRRAQHDDAVPICILKRFVGDHGLSAEPYLPPCAPASGKRVAIIGAGPAGLSAAFYLQQLGHACTVFDRAGEPGGALRSAIPGERLPRAVLDGEIGIVRLLGAAFRMNTALGRDVAIDHLRSEFDAVVIAIGAIVDADTSFLKLGMAKGGIKAQVHTHETSERGVFACGDAVHANRMAVRAVAAGRATAASVGQFLSGGAVTGLHTRFDSMLGRLREGEMAQFLEGARPGPGLHVPSDRPEELGEADARAQAERCLHCDCRKPEECALRNYAGEYDAKQRRYAGAARRQVEIVRQHASVVYEPGKCIKCGLCVTITEQAREELGLTFVGRGFDVRVAAPFSEPLSRALARTADECVAACPTGALAHSGAAPRQPAA
ncbi:NAD(P)-binding protein [bacterium]|nr:NAD(P)-binding protein [bacterium]